MVSFKQTLVAGYNLQEGGCSNLHGNLTRRSDELNDGNNNNNSLFGGQSSSLPPLPPILLLAHFSDGSICCLPHLYQHLWAYKHISQALHIEDFERFEALLPATRPLAPR
jgi:hypothetical protein